MYAPRISEELRKLLTDMLRAEIPLQVIYDIHSERQIDIIGKLIDQKSATFASLTIIGGKDERLTKQVIFHLSTKVKMEKDCLHRNDAVSVHMWIQLNQERVLYIGSTKLGLPVKILF
jgi:hypothetical protein